MSADDEFTITTGGRKMLPPIIISGCADDVRYHLPGPAHDVALTNGRRSRQLSITPSCRPHH